MKTILSQKGQVVIPKEIREKLKLEKGSVFEIELQDNLIILKPVGKTLKVRHWKELRGLLKGKYSTRQFLEERRTEKEKGGHQNWGQVLKYNIYLCRKRGGF
ncbi:MAG: AbrB/MazE/SpoVT family DNA-binding domain-containing protein [Candidatus Desulfofervidus auxilii]|nr:AbrB/MazE/SpoVT family DNA-binding domain-containing protein [Candidatus Desulfofervidus auxilii]